MGEMLNLERRWNRWLAALAMIGWVMLMVWLGCTWLFGTRLSAEYKTSGVVITGAFASGCLSLLVLSVVLQDIQRGETTWLTKRRIGGDGISVTYQYIQQSASRQDQPFSYIAALAVKFLVFLGCTFIAIAIVWLTSTGALVLFHDVRFHSP